MFKLVHTSCKLSSGYHPETNGQSECTNQTIEQYLRCFINYQEDDWVDLYYIRRNFLTTIQNILLLDIPHSLQTLGTILVGRCLNIPNSRKTRLLKIGSLDSKKFRISFPIIYIVEIFLAVSWRKPSPSAIGAQERVNQLFTHARPLLYIKVN